VLPHHPEPHSLDRALKQIADAGITLAVSGQTLPPLEVNL